MNDNTKPETPERIWLDDEFKVYGVPPAYDLNVTEYARVHQPDVIVGEAARRIAEKIVATYHIVTDLEGGDYGPMELGDDEYEAECLAELIATELCVHQDVQAADVKEKARRVVDAWRFEDLGADQTIRFMNTEPLVERIAAALAASPVQQNE